MSIRSYPKGIEIPAVMSMIYDDRFWGFRESATHRYRHMRTPHADACIRCRKCEKACTQRLKIVTEMAYAAKTYAEPAVRKWSTRYREAGLTLRRSPAIASPQRARNPLQS